jgi:hypothetical protein
LIYIVIRKLSKKPLIKETVDVISTKFDKKRSSNKDQ